LSHLFWFRFRDHPLVAVAATNRTSASRAFGTSMYLLTTYGGRFPETSPDGFEDALSRLSEQALRNVGVVYRLTAAKWEQLTPGDPEAPAPGAIASEVIGNRGRQRTRSTPYDPIRTIKLTEAERSAFDSNGGVSWLTKVGHSSPSG
jgi:hypothetical protein